MPNTLTLISLDAADKRLLNQALTMLGTEKALAMRDRINDKEY